MSTAQDIIEAALENIGSYSPGESLGATDGATCLKYLNRLLSSLATERLIIYSETTESFAIVAGTVSYTIGAGATFNTVRPMRIEGAYLRDSNGNDYYLRIIKDRSLYDSIFNKDISSRPRELFYDPAYPIGTIYLDSAPHESETLYLVSWKPFATFGSLTTEVVFPEGYEELLIYTLAKRLCLPYSKEPSALLLDLESKAKKRIKNFNAEPKQLICDVPQGRGDSFYDTYDIRSGYWLSGGGRR